MTTSGASALTPVDRERRHHRQHRSASSSPTRGRHASTTAPSTSSTTTSPSTPSACCSTTPRRRPIQAYVASNIFWENHDQTAGAGTASRSSRPTPTRSTLRNNLFFGNGASDDRPVQRRPTPCGNGFSSGRCWERPPRPRPDNLGNFVGNPAFVFPIDPRPGSDGPANFFLDADFQLTGGVGGHRQRLGGHGDPDRLPGQLAGQDLRQRLRAARLRPSRHRCLRVRRDRRHSGRRCLPRRHHLAGAGRRPVQGQRRDRERHRRTDVRSPSPSPGTSTRPTSIADRPGPLRLGRQPVGPGTRHQPDLDRRPHGRVQPDGSVQHERARSTCRWQPNSIHEHAGYRQSSATPTTPCLSVVTITRSADVNPTRHRRRLDRNRLDAGTGSPAPTPSAGTARPAPPQEGPRRRPPPEEAGQTRRRPLKHKVATPKHKAARAEAQGRARRSTRSSTPQEEAKKRLQQRERLDRLVNADGRLSDQPTASAYQQKTPDRHGRGCLFEAVRVDCEPSQGDDSSSTGKRHAVNPAWMRRSLLLPALIARLRLRARLSSR